MITSGIPRFTNVGACHARGESPFTLAADVSGRRATGNEDDIIDLFVSKLWMSGFFCLRVPVPVSDPLCFLDKPDDAAASCGEMMIADEAEGSIARHR